MRRTFNLFVSLAIIGAGIAGGSPSPVLACNPDDCGGLSAEELARDRAEIRRLNRAQKRYVDRRDAEYARGWDAQRAHSRDMAAYQAEREAYERSMARWREAVRRCRAGDYRYCDG